MPSTFLPENQDSEDLDTIAKAVGLVVLNWSQAEQSLDLAVASLWQSFDGSKHAKRIPFMLEPKIKFIRKCISETPALVDLKEETEALLAEFTRLSSLRHDLIHGAAASISPVDQSFVFAKLDVRDGFHHHREVKIPIAAYPGLVRELVTLGRSSYEFAKQLFERSPDE